MKRVFIHAAERIPLLYAAISILLLLSQHTGLAFGQKAEAADKSAAISPGAFQRKEDVVHFPNGINVRMVMMHPMRDLTIVSKISPNGRYVAIRSKRAYIGWNEDYFLYDFDTKSTYLIIEDSDRAFLNLWSYDGRYINGSELYDAQEKKIVTNPGKKYKYNLEWSRKDDRFVYYDSESSKHAFIGEIQNNEIVSHPAKPEEIRKLLGEAYFPALKEARRVSNVPPCSDMGVLYPANIPTRSFHPSPDGSRVLLQNLRHRVVGWTPSDQDTCYYYIIDKNGIKLKRKTNGTVQHVFTQWLDNRWLIGWYNPEERDYDDVNPGYSVKQLYLILWDTNTGKVWKAKAPRHHRHDGILWSLIPASKSGRSRS